MNPTRVICIFALLVSTQAIAQRNPDGTCLLQKAVERGSVMSQVVSFAGTSVNAHRNWRSQHKLLLTETTESMDVLEEFIEKQEESGDACSARLFEAKRALDGLLKDLSTLEKQIDSHEEVLETETENLNITDLAVDAVKTTHGEDMAACEKKKQEAMDRVSMYEDELEEFDQIAKPGVRYEHVTKMPNLTLFDSKTMLLQHLVWTKESCVAFAQLQKKKRKHAKHAKDASNSAQDPDDDNNNANNEGATNEGEDSADKVDCDAQREELQKAFTEAVLATRDLLKKAQDDVADTSCVDEANTKKATALVPLTAQRERAASLIESSSGSLAALDPIMDLTDMRVEKLSNHIYDVLTPECAEAKEVSEALQKIRELIQMLEECPGRNNFKLKIPPTEAPATEDASTDEADTTTTNEDLGVKSSLAENSAEVATNQSLLANSTKDSEDSNEGKAVGAAIDIFDNNNIKTTP